MLFPVQPKSNQELLKKTQKLRNNKNTEKESFFETETDKIEISFSQALETEFTSQSQNSSVTPVKEIVKWDEISSLVGNLENRGQALSRLPSLENFHQFRNLLQKIINKVIPQALEIKKDFSLNPTDLSQKEFHLITGVNKELNSLLKMIESNHKDHFKIANQVISIKGLIVDFYG